MPVKAFDDRNNFYFNLNYKVVWLFDLSDIVQNGNMSYRSESTGLSFIWNNPKKAFNSYDVKSGCIDLFFQLSDSETACIVKVLDVSEAGFESFNTSYAMNKSDFLEYVGLIDGVCQMPDLSYKDTNESYLRFKDKYNIKLNKQQERTVQSVEGAVLLLAVPGSGKTTVMVDRLGYMVCEKGIDPGSILAITFNKNAAEEMKNRYINIFGGEFDNQIDFRTINSLSLEIYYQYCEKNGKDKRKPIKRKELRKLLADVYKEFHTDEYPSEYDINELETAIAYTKNMMLSAEEILCIDDEYPQFSSMFKKYCGELAKNNRMDFDDQMVFAHWILTNDSEQLSFWQNKYKYICVDEAQDTSKIQHAIIQILAKRNNIFMVGDEDQSIYGFRAAYPKALLNFRSDYKNPYIMRMERNYRSTPQIIEKAQSFISENMGRYEKHMVADRCDGKPVELIAVDSIEDQYLKLLSVAKDSKRKTAFLYKDNESSVVLVDLFLRNNILFNLKTPELNFFGNKIVQDIVAYLSLIIDPYDVNSLKQIRNKGVLYLKRQQLDYAVKNCIRNPITVFEAVESQMQYMKFGYRDRAEKFKIFYDNLSNKTAEDAIRYIMVNGYRDYLQEKNQDMQKVETLLILAKYEPDIAKYLNHLKELELEIKKGFDNGENLVLSTIHSSKGLEYDVVYMVDVYDGRFPSSKRNIFNRSKDNADAEQEERRLFYVGITRAKNELYLFNINEKPSSYIESLFPDVMCQRILMEENEKQMQYVAAECQCLQSEKEQQVYIEQKKLNEKRKKEEEEKLKVDYEQAYNEVKDLFVQQETPIWDSYGKRWVKCEVCGRIKFSDEFITYGGLNHANLGVCHDCYERH